MKKLLIAIVACFSLMSCEETRDGVITPMDGYLKVKEGEAWVEGNKYTVNFSALGGSADLLLKIPAHFYSSCQPGITAVLLDDIEPVAYVEGEDPASWKNVEMVTRTLQILVPSNESGKKECFTIRLTANDEVYCTSELYVVQDGK